MRPALAFLSGSLPYVVQCARKSFVQSRLSSLTYIAAGKGCRARMSTTTDDNVMARVERKISDALSPKSLSVNPTYGDPNGSHVSIRVVSDMFEGKNVVKRHQLVYKAIWDELQV